MKKLIAYIILFLVFMTGVSAYNTIITMTLGSSSSGAIVGTTGGIISSIEGDDFLGCVAATADCTCLSGSTNEYGYDAIEPSNSYSTWAAELTPGGSYFACLKLSEMYGLLGYDRYRLPDCDHAGITSYYLYIIGTSGCGSNYHYIGNPTEQETLVFPFAFVG